MLFIDELNHFLSVHHIDFFKDIILPGITLDKVIALTALIYAIRSYIANSKLARINFSYQINNAHRDIWSKTYNDTGLKEVTNPNADITNITKEQRRFVVFILLNNEISYDAFIKGIHDYTLASQKDTGDFFNLPIPDAVWSVAKEYYEPEFVTFIDGTKSLAKLKNFKPKSLRQKIFYRLRSKVRKILLKLGNRLK
ncbi:hypothetical protein [Mucilaginibacter pedocola]|uniref:Uncharacterized protein n=1 Tax=Mucilaginibacter pedocola TaxID=1792845 RepID=A0A1S9P8V3_9SPHI|nr:hypothetical protein [Mucilaginibacter pedocola]OOQ57375.1 hypothetical protein BC343_14840 [Mucilaginibacter pedocola]